MPDTTPIATDPHPGVIDWAAGASLGLLLGLLVGLSASPVVSSVIAALVALLAGLFGLSEKLPIGLSTRGAHRLTVFALAATAAVLLGLALRTQGLLMPSVAEQRRQLADIGITELKEQNQMLRFLRYGLLPAGTQAAGKDGEAAKLAVAAGLPVLYAEAADFCGSLRRLISQGSAPADMLLQLRTGGEAAQHAARSIQGLPEAERTAAVKAAPYYLCSP